MKKSIYVWLVSILIVGALVGLFVYLDSIPTTAEKAAAVLSSIKIGSGETADPDEITAAIQRGIDASNAEHAIKKEAEAETAEILEMIKSLPTAKIP